jgi:uncharacterized protein
MATYRSPDVYVEEISLFPPSVAEVETAIPAFIGYTEKADLLVPNDLHLIPFEVDSLLEFEALFGKGAPLRITDVIIDQNNNYTSSDMASTFYMYDSIRMFFANGGGKCYITSINRYSDVTDATTGVATIVKTDFDPGLDAVSKQDDPTILLFPDAVLLTSGTDFYDLQVAALKQCNDLQDRVAVLDLQENSVSTKNDIVAHTAWKTAYQAFRNSVGINYLKYGAAYTPWLVASFTKNITYKDLQSKIKRSVGGASLPLSGLTSDPGILASISKVENAITDQNTINTNLNALFTAPSTTFSQQYQALLDAYNAAKNKDNFNALFTLFYNTVNAINSWVNPPLTPGLGSADLRASIGTSITGTLKAVYTKVIAYDKDATNIGAGYGNVYSAVPIAALFTAMDTADVADLTQNPPKTNPYWAHIFGASSPATASPSIFVGANANAKAAAGLPTVNDLATQISAAINAIFNASQNLISKSDSGLQLVFPAYKNILDSLNKSLSTLPPSGAIAGIYAMVDRNRGVWKAPANVSLTDVVAPVVAIDRNAQDDINIDVNAGKSINAIRSFTGKGVMVWGARTLAGNDNEWRYVPVRRFFNMVEESVKKSTYWAVFEPNDANTWMKVKSMIENYLLLKWKDGALAGAKPDDAFFVKIGIGQTMTSQDILEGRMNVEIGMAAVRPAEFIILKFSHKLQTS